MYNTAPKSREWLTINYAVNATRTILLGFYILRGEWLCDYYIKLYKSRTYITMQKKTWMTIFLQKKIILQ